MTETDKTYNVYVANLIDESNENGREIATLIDHCCDYLCRKPIDDCCYVADRTYRWRNFPNWKILNTFPELEFETILEFVDKKFTDLATDS